MVQGEDDGRGQNKPESDSSKRSFVSSASKRASASPVSKRATGASKNTAKKTATKKAASGKKARAPKIKAAVKKSTNKKAAAKKPARSTNNKEANNKASKPANKKIVSETASNVIDMQLVRQRAAAKAGGTKAAQTKADKPRKNIRKGVSRVKAVKNAIKLAHKKTAAKNAKASGELVKKKTIAKSASKKTTAKQTSKKKPQKILRQVRVSDAERAEYDAQWQRVRSRLRAVLGDRVFIPWFKHLRVAYLRGGQLVVEAPNQYTRDHIESHYRAHLLQHWSAENPKVKRLAVGVQADWKPIEEKPITKVQQVRPAVALGRHVGRVPQKPKPQPDFETAGAPLDRHLTFDNFIIGESNQLAYAAAKRLAEIETKTEIIDAANKNAHQSEIVEAAGAPAKTYNARKSAEKNAAKNAEKNAAKNAGKKIAPQEERQKMNPLYLYGGVGLGKTHLMHAIAWQILEHKPDCKILYLPAERFMYQFIRALRHHDTIAFKQQFRELDVLMIDDIQFIAEKKATQEEFFHSFNALLGQNAQVVISADRAPQDIVGIDERIRSRLGGGMVADIRPTDYELRLGILSAKAANLTARAGAGVYDYLPTSVTHSLAPTHYNPKASFAKTTKTGDDENAAEDKAVPREVLEFLASKITHNVRELEGALMRVAAYASFTSKAIDLSMTKDVLRDLLRAAERRVSIDEIQRQVADYYKIRIADMVSDRRYRAVARPRQIAMYLAKELTPRSYPEIGRKFGGRDHSTVIHAVRRIAALREMDATLDQEVDLIGKMLK